MASWMLSSCPPEQLWKPPKLHLGSRVPEKNTCIMHHQEKIWKERVFCILFYMWPEPITKNSAFKHSTPHLIHKAADNTKAETWPWGKKPDLLQQPTLAKRKVSVNLHSTFRTIDLKTWHQGFQVSNIPEWVTSTKNDFPGHIFWLQQPCPFLGPHEAPAFATIPKISGQKLCGFMFRRVSLQYLLRMVLFPHHSLSPPLTLSSSSISYSFERKCPGRRFCNNI